MNNEPLQPPEQKPTPNIDDLIAQSTSQIYAFEHGKEKQSLKQRLLGLTKKQKAIIASGGIVATILVLTISLSFGSGTKQTLSSTQQASTSTTATTSPASTESDTNGDGIIDEYDTTSTDTTVSTGTSWWQKLLNINSSSESGASGDEADNQSDDSTGSDDSTADTTSTANAEVAENEDEEQQIAASTSSPSSTTSSSSTPATNPSTPAQTTPTTPTTTTTTTPTLTGVTNFRDASSSSTKLMKSGVLYRSAKLQNATKKDTAALASLLKNGAIIDLRTTKVRKGAPDASVSGITNLSYPIDAASSASTYVSIFVNNATDRKKFGDVITKIANTKGSVLIHCTAGKDRTGWTVAMVMYAVGANDKQVMTEYLKSKEYGAKVDSAWLKAALSAAKKKNKGSIITYIKSKSAGLGVSDSTITKLKAKLSAK
jgi:protein-tyrosine phosphatase